MNCIEKIKNSKKVSKFEEIMSIDKPQVNPHLSLERVMESAEVVISKNEAPYIFLCHVKVITMNNWQQFLNLNGSFFLRRFLTTKQLTKLYHNAKYVFVICYGC